MADTAATEAVPVPPAGGAVTVTPRVVEKVAVHAAAQVPGVVRTARGLSGATSPAASSEVAGGRARIRVQVALEWPVPAAVAAAGVRDAVGAAVGIYAGVTADRVDVVVGAYEAPEAPERVVR